MNRSRLKIKLMGDGKVGCSVLVVSFGDTMKEHEEKLTLLDIMEGTGFRKIDDKVWVVTTTEKMERGGIIEDQVIDICNRHIDRKERVLQFEYPEVEFRPDYMCPDIRDFSTIELPSDNHTGLSEVSDKINEKESQKKHQKDNRVKNNQKFYTPPKFQQREGSHCVGRQNWRHENKRSQHKTTKKSKK